MDLKCDRADSETIISLKSYNLKPKSHRVSIYCPSIYVYVCYLSDFFNIVLVIKIIVKSLKESKTEDAADRMTKVVHPVLIFSKETKVKSLFLPKYTNLLYFLSLPLHWLFVPISMIS